MLAAVFQPARARDHDVLLFPAGPAAAVWRAEERGMDWDGVDILVTGSGFGSVETSAWAEARERGIPSLAVIEAWTNLDLRLRLDGCRILPDRLAVPLSGMVDDLAALGVEPERVAVVGQPHLADLARRLEPLRRRPRAGRPPLIAFFSEPIAEDFPDGSRGLDQYGVFAQAARALAGMGPLRLALCLHPREPMERWRPVLAALPLPVELQPSGAMMEDADLALGVTTMMLVEALLAGLPALSLQPGRIAPANPLLDHLGMPVVTDPTALKAALAGHLAASGRLTVVPEPLLHMVCGAEERFLAAIEGVRPLKS